MAGGVGSQCFIPVCSWLLVGWIQAPQQSQDTSREKLNRDVPLFIPGDCSPEGFLSVFQLSVATKVQCSNPLWKSWLRTLSVYVAHELRRKILLRPGRSGPAAPPCLVAACGLFQDGPLAKQVAPPTPGPASSWRLVVACLEGRQSPAGAGGAPCILLHCRGEGLAPGCRASQKAPSLYLHTLINQKFLLHCSWF